MQHAHETTSTLDVEVEELLPTLGLAFVVDEAAHSWGVTRSTLGCQFDALASGRRVRLLAQSNSVHSWWECRLMD